MQFGPLDAVLVDGFERHKDLAGQLSTVFEGVYVS